MELATAGGGVRGLRRTPRRQLQSRPYCLHQLHARVFGTHFVKPRYLPLTAMSSAGPQASLRSGTQQSSGPGAVGFCAVGVEDRMPQPGANAGGSIVIADDDVVDRAPPPPSRARCRQVDVFDAGERAPAARPVLVQAPADAPSLAGLWCTRFPVLRSGRPGAGGRKGRSGRSGEAGLRPRQFRTSVRTGTAWSAARERLPATVGMSPGSGR
jgi:hypothetical protein